MEIEKPKIKDISLKDVARGTPEFYEMIKYLDRMEKSEQKNMRMEGQRSHATK